MILLLSKRTLEKPFEYPYGQRAASLDFLFLETLIKIRKVLEAVANTPEEGKTPEYFMPTMYEDIYTFLSRVYRECGKKTANEKFCEVASYFKQMRTYNGMGEYVMLESAVSSALGICYVMDFSKEEFTRFLSVQSENRPFSPAKDSGLLLVGIVNAIIQLLSDSEFELIFDILKAEAPYPTSEANDLIEAAKFVNELADYKKLITTFKSTWDVYRGILKCGPSVEYDREKDSFFVAVAKWCDAMADVLIEKEFPDNETITKTIKAESELYRRYGVKLRVLDKSYAKETMLYLFYFDEKMLGAMIDAVSFKNFRSNTRTINITTSHEVINKLIDVITDRFLRRAVNIHLEEVVYEGIKTIMNKYEAS